MLGKSQAAMTVDEFCRTFKVGKTRAFFLLKNGFIERVKVGSSTRIPVESANAWWDSCRNASKAS